MGTKGFTAKPTRRVTSDQVTVWRFVYVIALLWVVLHLNFLDQVVEQSYEWLRLQWWFRHDSLEPVVATLAFALWLFWFQFLDCYLPLKQFLLDPHNRVVDYNTGIPIKSGAVYLGIILAYDIVFPRRKLPETGPGSFLIVVGHIVLAVFVYDLLFFPLHLAMHKVRYLRRFHETHHRTKALYSTEVLRHSFVDGSLQVGVNILTLNMLKLHPFTRMLYNIVITYMLTEIHSGYDLPWMLHNVVPFGLLGGSVRHEEHHKKGSHFFQQFFTYLDFFVLASRGTGHH